MAHIAKNVWGKEENRNPIRDKNIKLSFCKYLQKDNRIKWILRDEVIIEGCRRSRKKKCERG